MRISREARVLLALVAIAAATWVWINYLSQNEEVVTTPSVPITSLNETQTAPAVADTVPDGGASDIAADVAGADVAVASGGDDLAAEPSPFGTVPTPAAAGDAALTPTRAADGSPEAPAQIDVTFLPPSGSAENGVSSDSAVSGTTATDSATPEGGLSEGAVSGGVPEGAATEDAAGGPEAVGAEAVGRNDITPSDSARADDASTNLQTARVDMTVLPITDPATDGVANVDVANDGTANVDAASDGAATGSVSTERAAANSEATSANEFAQPAGSVTAPSATAPSATSASPTATATLPTVSSADSETINTASGSDASSTPAADGTASEDMAVEAVAGSDTALLGTATQQVAASQAGVAQPDTSQTDASQTDVAQTGTSHAGTSQADGSQTDASPTNSDEPLSAVAPDEPLTAREVEVAELPFLITGPPALDIPETDAAVPDLDLARPSGNLRATVNPFSPILLAPPPDQPQAQALASAGTNPSQFGLAPPTTPSGIIDVPIPNAPGVTSVAAAPNLNAPGVSTRITAPAPQLLTPRAGLAASLPRPLPGGTLPTTPDLLRTTRSSSEPVAAETPAVAPLVDLATVAALRVPGGGAAPDFADAAPPALERAEPGEAEPLQLAGLPGRGPALGNPVAAGTSGLTRYLRDSNYRFTGYVLSAVGVGVFRSNDAAAPVVVTLGQSIPGTDIVLTSLKGEQAELTLNDEKQILILNPGG